MVVFDKCKAISICCGGHEIRLKSNKSSTEHGFFSLGLFLSTLPSLSTQILLGLFFATYRETGTPGNASTSTTNKVFRFGLG